MKQTNPFTTIFKQPPDLICNADYFFHTDLDEKLSGILSNIVSTGSLPWGSIDEYYRSHQKRIEDHFYDHWYSRDILSEDSMVQSCFPWICDHEICAVLQRIAESRQPFLDIASSDRLGLAAFIKKISPLAPCLVSDTDMVLMQFLSTFLKTALPEYPFFCTSFDNNNIPICDNSLDYVTSLDGITSSPEPRKGVGIIGRCLGQDKSIAEVYRILKPGGYFVTVEQLIDCDFDLLDIYEYCEAYGKLYGIYSFDEIKDFLDWILEDSWERAFSSAGFVIETAKVYPHRLTTSELKHLLFRYTNCMGGHYHRWSEEDIVRNYLSKELFHVIAAAPTPADILHSKAFQKEWQIIGRFETYERQYTKEDIVDILWKAVRAGTIGEPCDAPEDFGCEVYDGSAVYVLKK